MADYLSDKEHEVCISIWLVMTFFYNESLKVEYNFL